jgi:hypothetical protein
MMDLIGFLFGLFVLTIAAGATVVIILRAAAIFGRPKAAQSAPTVQSRTPVYFLYMSPPGCAKGLGDGSAE